MSDDNGNGAADTGQVSVAELLARNGAKVDTQSGGRRRRGMAGGISVAELTGEIPVVRAAEPEPEPGPEPNDDSVQDSGPTRAPAPTSPPRLGPPAVIVEDRRRQPSRPTPAFGAARPARPEPAHPEFRATVVSVEPEVDDEVTSENDVVAPPRQGATVVPPRGESPVEHVDETETSAVPIVEVEPEVDTDEHDDETVTAEDTGDTPAVETPAVDAPAAETPAPAKGRSPARQWLSLIGQGVVAIVLGALLFKGFERLWEMLPWVALVLAFFVIVGLVAVVRVLRRTDDIVSILLAVVVGGFVTLGPLAFMLSTT